MESVIIVQSLTDARTAISRCLLEGNMLAATGIAQCLWVLGDPEELRLCRQSIAEEAYAASRANRRLDSQPLMAALGDSRSERLLAG